MATYRQIHVSFWQDGFVMKLTPEEKYFYIYLMTNSKTTQCGIYELPKKIICFETGYNEETVDKLLKRFIGYEKIQYSEETNEVILINWMKYNAINSDKVKQCIIKELKNVKNKAFVELFKNLCIQYGYGIDSLWIDWGEEEEKEKEKEEENTSSVEEEPPAPYKQIKDLYNDICISLTKVRSLSDERKKHIKARWKQFNYKIETFEEVFRKVEASDFCKGKNDRGWKADFDWLIKNDSNMVKVLEGKYDNKPQQDEYKPKSLIDELKQKYGGML